MRNKYKNNFQKTNTRESIKYFPIKYFKRNKQTLKNKILNNIKSKR